MSIQSTTAADRIAATAFNAASEKDNIAGNAFAALFGQAFAQQANLASKMPAAASEINAAKIAEMAAPKPLAGASRMPANEPAKQAAQGETASGSDTALEGTPKPKELNAAQKKTAAQSDKKEENANADATAGAMALSQQQADAVKTKPAANTSKAATGNTVDALQTLQAKRQKKSTDSSDAKDILQAVETKTNVSADAMAQATTTAQAGATAQAVASAKPQASAAIDDTLNGKSSAAVALKGQSAESALPTSAAAAAQSAVSQTALPAAGNTTQDTQRATNGDAEATLATAATVGGTDTQPETAPLKSADLPDFNRLLTVQSPAKEASQAPLMAPVAENAANKTLQPTTDARPSVVSTPKEAQLQTVAREEVLSNKTAPLSASVSDAGAAAKTAVAPKSETGLNESQIAARGTATPERPRVSAINLQQSASVQSSSNTSNVTTMAVEGLESKAAVPQNTGLQAAGLSVFQAMQRQDEPLKMEIATPITQPGFTEELQETVKLVSTRDLREVEVTISPEELGPIKLKVQMTGDKADVTFQADNEQTRTLLAEAVSGLTESLAESGIDLRNATVEKPTQSLENNTANLFQGQGNREQRNSDANFQQGQNRGGRQDSTNAGSDNTPKQAAETSSRRSNGLLDTYA